MPETQSMERKKEILTTMCQLLIQAPSPLNSKRAQLTMLVKSFYGKNEVLLDLTYAILITTIVFSSETAVICTSFIFVSYNLKWQITWRKRGMTDITFSNDSGDFH